MKETPEKFQWHPAFYAATELELRENYDDLEFEPEHNLSKAPLQMDLLIIKKWRDVELLQSKNMCSDMQIHFAFIL